MLAVLDFLISGFLIWLSTQAFPEYAATDSLMPLIFSTIIFYGIVTLALFGSVLFMIPGYRRDVPTRLLFVICTVIASIIGAIALRYICPLITGFTMTSFWLALLVSVAACFIVVLPRLKRR